MSFFYYEFDTDRFLLTSNMKAVSEFSGIPYNKVYKWFPDGDNIYKDSDKKFICFRTVEQKGRQRVKVEKKDDNGKYPIPEKIKEEFKEIKIEGTSFDDFFKDIT